jgi:hypothetical protein
MPFNENIGLHSKNFRGFSLGKRSPKPFLTEVVQVCRIISANNFIITDLALPWDESKKFIDN